MGMGRITFQDIKPRQQLHFLCRKDQNPSFIVVQIKPNVLISIGHRQRSALHNQQLKD